jgi:hypothetical protein
VWEEVKRLKKRQKKEKALITGLRTNISCNPGETLTDSFETPWMPCSDTKLLH